MLTTMKKKRKDENEDRLVNAVLEFENVKLTFVKRMLNESKKRKKSDEMFIMSKASCPIDHDNLLMNTEVSEFQKVRDNLRRLVRGYWHVGLSLLEMNYQSNQWYLSVSLRVDKFKVFHPQGFLLRKMFWTVNEFIAAAIGVLLRNNILVTRDMDHLSQIQRSRNGKFGLTRLGGAFPAGLVE